MTLGTGGRGPQVSLWRGRRLWALLAAGRQLVFLSVQKVRLGTGGRGPPFRPSGPCWPCCFAVARAPFVGLVGGWKRASFLVGSESDVRHWGPWPAGPVRPSGPCCFAVARAPFVGLVGGWKTASFLVGSESDVRHWGPWPAAPGPSLRALLFRCGEGAVCGPCWRLEDS